MFSTILIGVDPNDIAGADALAAAATRLADPDGAAIHVVAVLPDYGLPIVAAAMGPDHARRMTSEAEGVLEPWIGRALPGGTVLHVMQGTVYDRILRVAADIGADAIVVGAHRPEFKDYLVGPNAARVMRHASQSVLVVR